MRCGHRSKAHADQTIVPSFSAERPPIFHWELEFPEVFLTDDGRPRPDGGFDAVVGNPPYVQIQDLGREMADYCRRRYDTASGSFDVYVPFLERSLSLLGPGGRLGFIMPNRLLKLDYAARLRELLSAGRLVEEIIDFGDAQVFEGATNYTCVVVLDRRGTQELDYRRVSGDSAAVRRALIDVDRLPGERFDGPAFGSDPWRMAAGEEGRILREAAAGAARLDEVTSGIFTGLQTSADPIYILEDRGRRGETRRAFSSASGEEVELRARPAPTVRERSPCRSLRVRAAAPSAAVSLPGGRGRPDAPATARGAGRATAHGGLSPRARGRTARTRARKDGSRRLVRVRPYTKPGRPRPPEARMRSHGPPPRDRRRSAG